ncbi:Derlin, partial [Ochromonadaceae sp. CCMP2298]
MNRPVAGVNDGDSIKGWFNDVPIVTKVFLCSTLLSGAVLTLGLFSAFDLVLDWPNIRYKFHFWKLLTNFFFAGKFSFNFAIHTYVLYENCRRYEEAPFNTGAGGSSADFLWLILMAMALMLVAAYYLDIMVLSEAILYVVMYVWSRRDPDSLVKIFGFKFKALYLPWVYIGIRVVMG